MMKLDELRDAIMNSGHFLDKELLCEVLRLNGYEVKEHSRYWLRLGMRRPGHDSHWQSVPDLGKFDSAHRFLLEDVGGHVERMFEMKTTAGKTRWHCEVHRPFNDEITHFGRGTGICAGYALVAAWVVLMLHRSKR